MWIVDPLDGTKEFIKKNGEFTVNIALVEDGVPTLGVIYVPVKKRLYFGAYGIGSYRVDPIDKLSPEITMDDLMTTASRLPLPEHTRPYTVVASRSHLSVETGGVHQ